MSIIENIQSHLDNGEYVVGVFVDLKKAFDTVDHDILLSKLEHYGVRGISIEWFKSYLKHRRQYVSLENNSSSTKYISTGVPQGSVLGPLLFLIYINDLHKCLKHSKAYHFADDTNILNSHHSLETLAKKMNYDLKKLSQWLKANKLSLNVKKTELMIFHSNTKTIDQSVKFKLDGRRLNPSNTVKYLGVLLDPHLQWIKQLNHVRMKLNRAVGILSRLRQITSLKILKITYHALFGSHLLYGSQLWGQTTAEHQEMIQTLQNRALRKITFKKRQESVTDIYKEYKILKFKDSIHLQNCLFMSLIEEDEKIAESFASLKHCGDNHHYQTRSKTKKLLDIPLFKTDTYGTHSVKYNCIVDWNNFKKKFPSLPPQDYTYFKVKKILKNYYISEY